MSLIAAKYFENKGWVLIKNRDRSYKPIIRLRKSFRNGVERLYMWDEVTKYSEGINEFGIGIIACDIATQDDDLQGAKEAAKDSSITKTKRRFYSPNGLRIRKALFEKTVYDTTKKLIELEIPGNTLIADRKTCFILEGAYTSENGVEEYVYKVKEIPNDHVCVRSNHGLLLPWTGYSLDVPEQKEDRLSSEARYAKALELVKKAQTPDALLDACSDTSNKDPQLNPLRMDDSRAITRTTGQIILCPKEMTLYYRPIWCETLFDIETLNKQDERTFFEIISSRKLLRLQDVLEMRKFKEYVGSI